MVNQKHQSTDEKKRKKTTERKNADTHCDCNLFLVKFHCKLNVNENLNFRIATVENVIPTCYLKLENLICADEKKNRYH